MVEQGEPAMRANQLSNHYFGRLTRDPDQMSDLPKLTRNDLAATYLPELLTQLQQQRGDQGNTIKTLYQLTGGATLETVLMSYPDRVTVCVSSQAGCGIGCPFCATGRLGLIRNLSAAEIVEQVRLAAAATRHGALAQQTEPAVPNDSTGIGHDSAEATQRLSNVVFMGMGEPLANYNALVTAIRAISQPPPDGFGISVRHLTVSTAGIVPQIDKLAGEGLPLRLAVSLHAPDDQARNRLVPLSKRYPVDQLLDAAYAYHKAVGRPVSIEYALIKQINDQLWRANLLAEKLEQRGTGWARVNLIGLNHVPGSPWTASPSSAMDRFVERLRQFGIVTTIRDSRGADIDGACGQLAARGVELRAR
jgi:23S rRNA (adenine2503-C2)-methyltransferase